MLFRKLVFAGAVVLCVGGTTLAVELAEGELSGPPTAPPPLTEPLGLGQSHGASLDGIIWSVVFGSGIEELFLTGEGWLGAADGDNPSEFFAADCCTDPRLFRVNPSTASAVLVGSYGGPEIREIAYDAAGDVLYGTDYASLYTIDTTSGSATEVGLMGDVGQFWALGYHAGLGKLFGVSNATDFLYEVDTTTGQLTTVGPTLTHRVTDIQYDPITDTLYGVTDVGGGDEHYTIDTASGAATLIGERMGGNLTGLGDLGSPGDVPAVSNVGFVLLVLAMLATLSLCVYFLRMAPNRQTTSRP